MLEGPSQRLSFFGVLPMTRLGFAVLAIVLVVFSELEQTRSLARLVFVLGGLPVAWLFVRGSAAAARAFRECGTRFAAGASRSSTAGRDFRVH